MSWLEPLGRIFTPYAPWITAKNAETAIFVALAAMIIAGMGYANQKALRSRAVAEIAAISTAMESYKADNGEYVNNAITSALLPLTLYPEAPDDPGWGNPPRGSVQKWKGDTISTTQTMDQRVQKLVRHGIGDQFAQCNGFKRQTNRSTSNGSRRTMETSRPG